MQVNFADIGKYLEGAAAIAETGAVAAGGGDAAYVDGIEIDLQTFVHRPTSAALVVHYTTTLTADKTLSLKTKVEEGDADATEGVYGYRDQGTEIDHGVVSTGAQTALSGVIVRSVDLRGIKRYFRGSVYQDLSHSSTDTNQLSAVWLFFSGEAPAVGSV